jgi:polysaccharide pyruvyl transferase WcaK-like protein
MGLFVKWKMPTSKIYSKPESLQNFSHRYDAVIVGSDQIWDINSPIRGVDTSYFLDFIASTDIRKISYAASFGSTSSLGEHKEKISGLLDSFYRLSVRDSNSLKLLEQECKRQAVKVLDPTFLIQYDNLVGKNKGREDHILVYGGLPASLTQPIRDLSKKLNLPVISVGHINNQVAEISNLQAGPIQWLKYFASAKYIFTNYYHGVIFSIIFRKPFSVFLAEKKIWKIGDLLKDLGLSDRIYSDTTKLKPGFSEINYSSVFEKIEEKRSIARQYLLDSLEYGN